MLVNADATVELIADGIHVHEPAIKLLYKAKGPNRIILVTDAIRAKGLSDGESELGGQKVNNYNGIAKLEDGGLANSRFFDDIKDVPTHAITVGLSDIMNAKRIILLALGRKKSQAVYDMLYGEVSEKIPVSILQKHENVLVLLDTEAAERLSDDIK